MEYIVVYESSLEKFYIEHCRINVKITAGFQKFPLLAQYKMLGSITLAQAVMFILSMCGHLILIYKIYEYRQS